VVFNTCSTTFSASFFWFASLVLLAVGSSFFNDGESASFLFFLSGSLGSLGKSLLIVTGSFLVDGSYFCKVPLGQAR